MKPTRYLETEEAAIKVAKSEARRFCCTHYVYPAEQGFFVRRTLLSKPLPLLKVKFDGSVEDLRKCFLGCEEPASDQCPKCKQWYCAECREAFLGMANIAGSFVSLPAPICPDCHYKTFTQPKEQSS